MKVVSFGPSESSSSSLALDLVTVSLHGFPGVRSRQNRDIAQTVAEKTGRRADALFYAGLGHAEGTFGFRECRGQVRAYFRQLFGEQGVRSVDLIGHSWGGYLALTIAREHPGRVRRIALLSPLLRFADESLCAPAFEDMARENPEISLGDSVALARQFDSIGGELPPEVLVGSVPETVEILYLQAREDAITPTAVAQEMLPHFRRPPRFELVDTDHSFLVNREDVAERISRFFQ